MPTLRKKVHNPEAQKPFSVSPRALVLLLGLVVFTSVGVTWLTLDRLGTAGITGYAASLAGKVNVTILAVNSVSMIDSSLNFTDCTPVTGGSLVESNTTSSACLSLTNYPDNLTIANDGNTNINVSVKTNMLAGQLIGGSNATFAFITRNATFKGGCTNVTRWCAEGNCSCAGFLTPSSPYSDTVGPNSATANCSWVNSWTNFSVVNNEYPACHNLTFGTNNNRFELYVRIYIPFDAPPTTATGTSGRNASLTFTASTIS